MDVLAEIAACRTGQGLSQAALANRLNVPRLAITRLESGTGSVALLLRVMETLGFRVSGIAKGATLPAQLRAKRKRLGLAIGRAAEKAGIDPRSLKAVERGDGSVSSLIALLNAIAPRCKKSDPPRASWAYDPRGMEERDKRFTPKWFFDHVVAAFGPVDLDPCAHEQAAVEARRRIIPPEDGLTSSWASARLVYVNPPFSAVSKWMARAADAWDRREAATIVMLVPARTDSEVYQKRVSRDADTLFLAGRIRFESTEGLAWPAPFSLMIVVWGGTEQQILRFVELAPGVRMRPWAKGLIPS